MAKNHRCVGDADSCEFPAVCKECGRSATPGNPVRVIAGDAPESVCEYCRSYAGDSDAIDARKIINHEPACWVENPETGEGSYAATTADGYPVLASGAIEGCDCGECEGREDWSDEPEAELPHYLQPGVQRSAIGTVLGCACADCSGAIEKIRRENEGHRYQGAR